MANRRARRRSRSSTAAWNAPASDKWLRATLTEASLAATRKKDTYLAARYQRLRERRGHSKALTAVSHSILTAAWHMLSTGETHRETGADYYTRQNPDRATRSLVRRLKALTHHITIEPREATARRDLPSDQWAARSHQPIGNRETL